MFENAKKYAKQYLKTWIFGLVAAMTSVIYVIYSMVKLEQNTDIQPLTITSSIVIGVVCAVLTKSAYGEIGFEKGYNSEIWSEEIKKYNEACTLCLEYNEYIDEFTLKEMSERRKTYRLSVLSSQCMRYSDWFDEEGNYCGDNEKRKRLDKYQEKALRRCITVKIYVPDMFKEKSKDVENYRHPDKTDSQQRVKSTLKNTFAAIIPNFVFVILIPTLNGWNWSIVISSLITVCIWLITGLLQMYNNYNFVTQEKVTQLREKKELMSKFINYCKNIRDI